MFCYYLLFDGKYLKRQNTSKTDQRRGIVLVEGTCQKRVRNFVENNPAFNILYVLQAI